MTMEHASREHIRALEQLSPFELKNELIALARERTRRSDLPMLNAGRGNPNFIATTPREAFFRLGFFALEESRRDIEWDPELVGVPQMAGIADRFRRWLVSHDGEPGTDLLRRVLDWGTGELGFEPDAFVWELADSIIGDHYPEPDRILAHNEAVTRRYLVKELCGGEAPAGELDLFAVEGGTAAMTYLFNTLRANRLAQAGDRVAIAAPIFTPYIEMVALEDFRLEQVELDAGALAPDGTHTWQFPDEEIDKLADPSVRILFLVNPTNPPSVRIAAGTLERLRTVVTERNPDLMIITDDVYGTFIDGFRSLMSVLPKNTATVYSFSKYFGATGWRLGVIAVARDNVFDRRLRALPDDVLGALDTRYESLTLKPRELRFIDRLVADSRNVALNHTAGLSLPQQCQMLLFSAYCLLDRDDRYKHLAQGLIRRRLDALLDATGVVLAENADRVGYYIELDLMVWARRHGQAFVDYLTATYEPTDVVFRLAEQTGVVLLNGGGFEGPKWSIRVSLANLRDEEYAAIGRAIVQVVSEYADEWRAAGGGEPAPIA
jgi:aspartate 4-decarboxylase